MVISGMRVLLPRDLNTVWETVTSLTDYAWRGDLDRIQVLNDTQFVEYTKGDYATTFTTTALEPCRRWEFDLENSNLTGHWQGLFSQEEGQTLLVLVESVTPKRFWLRPFAKAYLKRQQARYIADLKRALDLEP